MTLVKGRSFFVIYVSYLTRESTLYFLNVNKYWHDRKRWEKEANIVKGAIFCYCRIYHKFVNFIILNLFKVVKWKYCFILLRGILVLWYGSQINTQKVNKHWHGRKGWEKESNTGCHRFYYLAPLPVLDPIYLSVIKTRRIATCVTGTAYLSEADDFSRF